MEVDRMVSSPFYNPNNRYMDQNSHDELVAASSSPSGRKRNRSPSFGSDGGNSNKRAYRKSTSRESDLDSLGGNHSRNGTESPCSDSYLVNSNNYYNSNLNGYQLDPQFGYNSSNGFNSSSSFAADTQMRNLRLGSVPNSDDFKEAWTAGQQQNIFTGGNDHQQSGGSNDMGYSRSWDGSMTHNDEMNSQQSQASGDTVMNSNSNDHYSSHQRRASFSTISSNDPSLNYQNHPNSTSSSLISPRPQRASSFGVGIGVGGGGQSFNSQTSSNQLSVPNQNQNLFGGSMNAINNHAPLTPSPLCNAESMTSSPASIAQGVDPSAMHDMEMELGGMSHHGTSGSGFHSGGSMNSGLGGQGPGGNSRMIGVQRPPLRFTMGFRNEKCELCRAGNRNHYSHVVPEGN